MNTETILLVLAMTGLSIGVYRANDDYRKSED